jgi:hypothetical protein
LHVGLLTMPGGKTGDCETMAEIVRPQSFTAVEASKLAGGAECRC